MCVFFQRNDKLDIRVMLFMYYCIFKVLEPDSGLRPHPPPTLTKYCPNMYKLDGIIQRLYN